MSDYMLLEYLKEKGMDGNEYLLKDFKNFMRSRGGVRGSMRHKDFDWEDSGYNRHDWDSFMGIHKARSYRDSSMESHFDEYDAKEIVSEMYHYENDRKITGEHFNMRKAEEVLMKHKDKFVVKATPCDVYVAINAAYHDFSMLLKTWFGSVVDEKIILLAITFWFKDDDYQGNKLMDYFM